MRIEDIRENTLYVYITQQNKDFFYFNYRDEQTIWVTTFNLNSEVPPGFISHRHGRDFIHERFWISKRGFKNEVYSQGWEAKKEDKRHLIQYIFELRLLINEA